MARYRATIQGDRGETSRLGTAKSGITAYINGWNIGVRVAIQPDPADPNKDCIWVISTGGSNNMVVKGYKTLEILEDTVV